MRLECFARTGIEKKMTRCIPDLNLITAHFVQYAMRA